MKALLDILWPRRCRLCDRILADDERFLCEVCVSALPRTLYHLREHHPMEERFAGIIPFERATAWLLYSRSSTVARMVHDFKYRGMPALASELGNRMGRELSMTGFFADADSVMPVPMHWFKQARRGYNQARCLAEGVARATGLEVLDHLYARRPHVTQTSKSMDERTRGMDNIFGVRDAMSLDGRHVVLVDDICTTGTTLLAAAGALVSAAPGCRLTLLALASTT